MKKLLEIAWVFLRIGTLGFGGPVATMAMMEEETHRRRGWITEAQYSEMYAITKMLPGPVAGQLAIFISKTYGGFAGGIIGGVMFVLPSFLLVFVLSALYVKGGQLADVRAWLNGLQIGALAVIFLSVEQMSRSYRSRRDAWAIALLSALLIFYRPRWEPLVILFFGIAGIGFSRERGRAVTGRASSGMNGGSGSTGGGKLLSALALPATGVFGPSILSNLFWTCFKAGAFVFGTGLAIVPMLEGDVVRHFHWVTHEQFMDGLAIGQVTPGPVVITVTFIGYIAAGWLGSLVATVGIFMPPFINILFLVPLFWARWSGSPSAQGFSSWAIPAVIGGILGTAVKLGVMTITMPGQLILLIACLLAAIRIKMPAWILIPASGIATGIAHYF